MTTFDPSKTITLDPAPMFEPLPPVVDGSADVPRLALQGLLILVVATVVLAAVTVVQNRATYWIQSERNRYVAEMAGQSLHRAHDVALESVTTARWTQTALGRDDAPSSDGSMWSIHVGEATVLGRGEINPRLGVQLHSPHGAVVFDSRGRSVGGSAHLEIDSQAPGDSYAIEVADGGTIVVTKVAP
jgi:hypothetical protein